jgi:benzoyl-CoA reductase/2-hydroxyglutaryl-CoA dehydratase subunit BcrC/BadD/HgdB
MMATAKYAGALFFELDRRVSCDYENIQCLAEQVAELIEFAKMSIPGIKYDEAKLIELQEMDAEAIRILRDTYELRKRVPCPISSQDCFRLIRQPSRSSNPSRVLEYDRIYRNELFERAEKGIGGVAEEKLRIAWVNTGPYARQTFDLLNRKGVSMVWFHSGGTPVSFGVVRDDYGDDSVYDRKLTPMQELVRHYNTSTWAGTADEFIEPLVQACRDLKVDAVVDFLQVGCIVGKNTKRIVSQRLREELGIPTLDLEGRQFYTSEADQIDMNKRLDEFLDMCIANKK